MIYLFYFQDFVGIWAKIAEQGVAIAVLALILIFVIILASKILPVWERVKTAESVSREAQAKSLGDLAASQTQLASVIKDVAIEQRRATDSVMILQRVNAHESQNITQSVDLLVERMDTLEDAFKEKSNANKSKTA